VIFVLAGARDSETIRYQNCSNNPKGNAKTVKIPLGVYLPYPLGLYHLHHKTCCFCIIYTTKPFGSCIIITGWIHSGQRCYPFDSGVNVPIGSFTLEYLTLWVVHNSMVIDTLVPDSVGSLMREAW